MLGFGLDHCQLAREERSGTRLDELSIKDINDYEPEFVNKLAYLGQAFTDNVPFPANNTCTKRAVTSQVRLGESGVD